MSWGWIAYYVFVGFILLAFGVGFVWAWISISRVVFQGIKGEKGTQVAWWKRVLFVLGSLLLGFLLTYFWFFASGGD